MQTVFVTTVVEPLQTRVAPVYDMYFIYFLTAIGLPPGGSSTVHINTQTIHRTTQLTQTIYRTTQSNNQED